MEKILRMPAPVSASETSGVGTHRYALPMGRYSYTTGNRWVLLAAFAAFVLFGGLFVVLAVTRPDGPPLLFVLAWIAILGWNAYWFLWRLSYRLEVDGDRLRWMTPLRTGEVRVSDVLDIHPGMFGQATVIELRDGETLTSPSTGRASRSSPRR